MKTNTDIRRHILKQMHSFTKDLSCVTYLLLSETMHLLQVQLGRGRRREALTTTLVISFLINNRYTITLIITDSPL